VIYIAVSKHVPIKDEGILNSANYKNVNKKVWIV